MSEKVEFYVYVFSPLMPLEELVKIFIFSPYVFLALTALIEYFKKQILLPLVFKKT